MSVLSCSILRISHERGILWEPVRVSSEENIIADAASRFRQVPDWSLSEVVAQKIFLRWGTPDVDLMATDRSRKVPLFYCRMDVEAWGLDSLAQDVDWSQFSLPYCFPPFPLLQQVLAKCRRQEVRRLVLVAPWWQGKPFFPTLLDMIIEVRRIPISSRLVMDLTTEESPPNIHGLKLVACLITGRSDPQPATSLSRQKSWLKPLGGGQQRNATVVRGEDGLSGAACREYRQLRPL